MHATELKRDYTTRYCLFAIDSAEYISMLPTTTKVGSGELIRSTTCCAGSRAISLDGPEYRLNGSDQWVVYKGGGGGGGEDVEPIPDANIEQLFD